MKAYFARKLAGVSADEPLHGAKARTCILDKGGVVAANVFTKITLALFGQYDWRGVPSMPPEIMLLPKLVLFQHLCDFLLVARGAHPLLIIFAKRPQCHVPPEQEHRRTVHSLRRSRLQHGAALQGPDLVYRQKLFSSNLDALLKVYDRSPVEWVLRSR